MANLDTSTHWRDSARTPKFFYIDARASFGILLFILRPHLYTLFIALVVIGILVALNYYLIPMPAAARIIRTFIAGPKKTIEPRR